MVNPKVKASRGTASARMNYSTPGGRACCCLYHSRSFVFRPC